MMYFEQFCPIRLWFGRGKLSQVGKAASMHGRKAFLVTGRNSARKTGLLDRVVDLLAREGVQSVIFDRVEQNPLTTTIAEGSRLLMEEGCDLVLGLGGGSPMDAAKGIAFSAVNPGNISEYIFGKPGTGALPIVLVTTTAGTGSEGDSLAVMTDPETRNKKSLKSPCIYPRISIVDPELMTTLPPPVIAATGIDALCHLIEGYLARRSQPFTAMMALQGIELVVKNLPKVYDNPLDLEAWDGMALANTLGGMVIDGSGVTLPHAMEHPVSGLLDVVHGQGLAALMPEILRMSLPACPDKFAKIAAAMGELIEGLALPEAAAKCVDGFEKLASRVNLTPTLSSLGVRAEHIDWLSHNSIRIMQAAVDNHPVSPGLEDIADLYRRCL